MGLYTELFYAIIPTLFLCSSYYIFNVFFSCKPLYWGVVIIVNWNERPDHHYKLVNLCYMVLISSSHSKKCCITYSGKTWWALNLVMSAKMLYFLIWQVFHLVILSANQQIPITTAKLATWQLAIYKMREVSSNLGWTFFGAIPSHLYPLLRCVLMWTDM